MTKPKLKPCPFCGCRPKLCQPGWGVYGHYVMCVAVRCAANPVTKNYGSREKAVAAWNRRAAETGGAE